MSHEIMYAVLMAKQPSVVMTVDDMCELNFRHCATSRKVTGSIAYGVIGIFLWLNPFRPFCGPRVDSVSNRNEYGCITWGKVGRCL